MMDDVLMFTQLADDTTQMPEGEPLEAPQYDDEDRPVFSVNTLALAVWAMRKLRARVLEAQQVADTATSEVQRIHDWAAAQTERARADIDWLEQQLSDYHAQVLKADPKAKTVTLPGGTLKARSATSWDWDDAAFVAWAKTQTEAAQALLLTTPEPKPAKTTAKQMLVVPAGGGAPVWTETGEEAAGVTVIPGDVKYTVTVD